MESERPLVFHLEWPSECCCCLQQAEQSSSTCSATLEQTCFHISVQEEILNVPTQHRICTFVLALRVPSVLPTTHCSPDWFRLVIVHSSSEQLLFYCKQKNSIICAWTGPEGTDSFLLNFVLKPQRENIHTTHHKLAWSPLCKGKVSCEISVHHLQIIPLSRRFNSPL